MRRQLLSSVLICKKMLTSIASFHSPKLQEHLSKRLASLSDTINLRKLY